MFEVFRAVNIHISVSWVMTLCGVAGATTKVSEEHTGRIEIVTENLERYRLSRHSLMKQE